MLIYKTNLAEKLFGYAVSREFIKFDTVLCNLLDEPDLQLDFELAINFNKAINGNLNARETFTNTFILCSGYMDPATINFYTRKMNNYPTFKNEIKRIKYIFANLDSLPTVPTGSNTGQFVSGSGGQPANTFVNEASPENVKFYNSLRDALKDCLNSPCNVFGDISTSVGRVTQGTTAANSISMLSIEPLKDTMISIANGIDMTIFNKIPAAFQEGITELSKSCSDAWGNIQSTFIEPSAVPVFTAAATAGQSLRSTPNNYIYTPDLKTYFDINTISSNILGQIAANLSGCFGRYEYAMRYNGYDPQQNLSQVSKSPTIGSVNGRSVAFNSVGQSGRVPQQSTEGLHYEGVTSNQPPTGVQSPEAIYKGETFVSGPITADTIGGTPPTVKVTIFAAWKDTETKTVWVDSYDKTPADINTRKGIANIGMVLTPSIVGSLDHVVVNDALNGAGGGVSGYTRAAEDNLDLTRYKLNAFNHGVATNENAYSLNGYSMDEATFNKLARENKLFVAVSKSVGSGYEIMQVIDKKGSADGGDYILDFTPYAFYKATGTRPTAGPPLTFVTGEWKQSTVIGVPKVPSMTIRYCVGNRDEVIAALAQADSGTSTAAPATAKENTDKGIAPQDKDKSVAQLEAELQKQALTLKRINDGKSAIKEAEASLVRNREIAATITDPVAKAKLEVADRNAQESLDRTKASYAIYIETVREDIRREKAGLSPLNS